ncbi:C-X-C motif chemokine 11-like [Osmerus eperlanus]|uniref:C-X-C motif chemokine 11-like n=1 Tax=Osmerus eperlanus TaxID=29151 RepID=UPI002E16701A
MRASTLLFLWIAVCGLVQAQSSGSIGGGSEKCLCKGKLRNAVGHKQIKSGPVVHPKNIFCMKIEIIITLKTGKQKCLDPNGMQGRNIINRINHRNQGQTNKQRRPKTNKRRQQKKRKGNSPV